MVTASAREGDPPPIRIDALVAAVVAGHPELGFFEAEVEAARAEGRSARAWADPELSISLGRASVREAGQGFSQEGHAWAVSLAQTFEWPGRIALRKAIAEHDLTTAQLALEGFRVELAGRVRSLAFGLLAARERAAAVQEVAARFRALRETFLAREPAGVAAQLEIRVVEAQELISHRRASQAQVEVDTTLIALNLLRGAEATTPLALEHRGRTFAEPPEPEALLSLALERNLGFRGRVVELERQGLRVALSRHERRPSITLAPFVEQERTDGRERTVGVGVSLPLPVGGRGAAAVEASAARLAQAEAGLRAAQVDLERALHTAVHAYRRHRSDLERWPAGTIESFREAAAAADRHYRLGALPVATYVELQSAYLEAVESVLDTEEAVLAAGLALESLTSGGWRVVEDAP